MLETVQDNYTVTIGSYVSYDDCRIASLPMTLQVTEWRWPKLDCTRGRVLLCDSWRSCSKWNVYIPSVNTQETFAVRTPSWKTGASAVRSTGADGVGRDRTLFVADGLLPPPPPPPRAATKSRDKSRDPTRCRHGQGRTQDLRNERGTRRRASPPH